VSRHRLGARLDRLEQSRRTATDFTIDPALARSLRDDYERWRNGRSSELEEKQSLYASIVDRARTIGLPVGYGPTQAEKDNERLSELSNKRASPRHGNLTDAEDAEEAQLRARTCAYEASPEGPARCRIFALALGNRCGRLSPAEQAEYDRLCADAASVV
jgi:hypothetical protein